MTLEKLRNRLYEKPPQDCEEWLNLYKKAESVLQKNYILEHSPYSQVSYLKGAVTRKRRSRISFYLKEMKSLPGYYVTSNLGKDLKALRFIQKDLRGQFWGAAWSAVTSGSKSFTLGNGKRGSSSTFCVKLYIPVQRLEGHFSYEPVYTDGSIYWSLQAARDASREVSADTGVPHAVGIRYGERLSDPPQGEI